MSETKKLWRARALLLVACSVSGCALLGYLSNEVTESRVVHDSQSHLESWFHESPSGAERACWADTSGLARAELPPHLAAGPNWRGQSRLDRWLFRPDFVFRPQDGDSCGPGRDEPWAYARSRQRLPFIARVHYGYFPDENGDSTDNAYEGVTTYFTFFGKSVPLNGWSVRPERPGATVEGR